MRSRLCSVCIMVLALAGIVPLAHVEAQLPPQDASTVTSKKAGLQQQLGRFEATALERVTKRKGLDSSDLSVISSSVAEYTLQGITAVEFKLMDKNDGQIYSLALDENGAEYDPEQLASGEEVASHARYGRMHPALATKLVTAAEADAAHEVIIWLKEAPSESGLERPDPLRGAKALETEAQVKAFFDKVDANRAAKVETVAAPVIRKLSNKGLRVTADKYAPVLYASMTEQAIQDVANWDEVDTVYLAPVHKPELNVSRATTYATTVHSRGFTGANVRVAQIEVGGRIATTNPYLSGVTQDGTYVCSSASAHSTGVAGIIRSTHPTYRGFAPSALLWAGGSCSGSSSQLQNRSNAAGTWGARVLNLSWGSNIGLVPGADDRFYDNMVINQYRTIVKSAGNRGSGCGGEGNITTPGLAYNVITVGNFDDRNTTSWTGDIMSSCSSWRDPTSVHGDREKPELAAPGTNIIGTTTAHPWVGGIGSGTSFAAPAVTGVAALMIQRNSTLSTWPEAIKAILMATAKHNIEGAVRLSEYDGAGAIRADYADDVTRRVNGNWGTRSYTCSTATPLNAATMPLTAGVRTRVVIVWDNDPNYSSYASQPCADLDLQVVSPSGTVVASSASWDNTYEIVDFTPSATGTYTLRINKLRCSYSPRYLAWAWHKGA